MNSLSLTNLAWDFWCLFSVIGIWPRFIEPKLLRPSHLNLSIEHLPSGLHGLRIVQISDLHVSMLSEAFLQRITNKITKLSPDLIVFTGDFLCFSTIEKPEILENFLNTLEARYGCYAILGNHDYAEYVSINKDGDYDIAIPEKIPLKKGFKKILKKIPKLSGKVTKQAQKVPPHPQLTKLLQRTPFKLLHNKTIQIPIKDSFLNLTGLGEHSLGRCLPNEAFKDYQKAFMGIVLTHNPDSLPYLQETPGNLILCGHTHGGQVNLPWLRRKFLVQENPAFQRGLMKISNKWVYINRGLGSVMPFRWFSPPEILLVTLEAKK